jgi:hypothetical protein
MGKRKENERMDERKTTWLYFSTLLCRIESEK